MRRNGAGAVRWKCREPCAEHRKRPAPVGAVVRRMSRHRCPPPHNQPHRFLCIDCKTAGHHVRDHRLVPADAARHDAELAAQPQRRTGHCGVHHEDEEAATAKLVVNVSYTRRRESPAERNRAFRAPDTAQVKPQQPLRTVDRGDLRAPQTISASAAISRVVPLAKSRNSKPQRGSSSRLPSVLKAKLPTKSGTVSVRASSMRTNPGAPPRWEASTPRLGLSRVRPKALAMKKVSAAATIACSILPSALLSLTSGVGECRDVAHSRTVIYFGQ